MSNVVDLDEHRRKLLADAANANETPLKGGGGGGTFDGMEPRIAKLEAQMESVTAELAKLANVPADVAGIRERLTHLPTKLDVKNEIDHASDRSAGRVQRTVAVAGGLVTLAVAAMNYLPKLLH